jgi:plasmid stabilization system protein ParE
MSFQVEISARAEADLDRLLARLRESSPESAERLSLKFWKSLARLRSHPFACGFAHESSRFSEEPRHLLFWSHPRRKYRALFVVRGEVAHFFCIRAPGEKPVRPEDIEL